jgi:hypothetical protein
MWRKMSFDKIVYRLTDKRIPAATGIGLVGDILDRAGFQEQFRNVGSENKRSRKQIDCGSIMTSFIGLLCMGKPDFDAIVEFQNDAAYYQTALHLKKGFPSSATLRQRMDEIGKTQREQLLRFNTHLLKSNLLEPTALKNGMIPLDMDVTPMDNSNTKKEGVSFTYKKFMGYAPMMAYIGREGYLVNTELREGKQHCQSGTPEFLRQTMKFCRKITDKPILVRLDSGNDAAENVGIMLENGAYYVIKRNLRKEDRTEWAENIKSWCKDISEPREGKKVYIGTTFKDIFYTTETGEQKSITNRIVYELIERDSKPDGQMLLVPEIELNMFWTNLGESDREIIDIYHAHGECEQFHSEIKTDMGVERLPSGKFDTNELVLELTMIAYNILRMLGQETIIQGKAPSKRIVSRKRIRTVIQNIIHFAGLLTRHARCQFLSISRSNAWANAFLGLVHRFAAC